MILATFGTVPKFKSTLFQSETFEKFQFLETLHKNFYEMTDIWPQIRRKQSQMRKANHKN